MQIVLLDTEATGLDDQARMIQLAYKNITTGDELNEYYKPSIPISYGAMAIHHITEEMVAENPVFVGSDDQSQLIKILKNNILVAHNALFDIKILNNEGVKVNKYIDTLRVARHVIDSEQYSMQYLRYSLKLEVGGQAHDAMGDVIVLEALFEYLINTVKEKYSLSSDNECYKKMLELTKAPVILNILKFGKYIGKTFGQVKEIDEGYLDWLYESESLKEDEGQNEDLVYTLKKYLSK